MAALGEGGGRLGEVGPGEASGNVRLGSLWAGAGAEVIRFEKQEWQGRPG